MSTHIQPRRLSMLAIFFGSLLSVLLVFPLPAFSAMAGMGQQLVAKEGQDLSYSAGISTTLLNGEGREFVYDPSLNGAKMSDLRWESDKVWLLGGEASVLYKNWLTFNIGYWGRATSSPGTHTDDDWSYANGLRFQTNFSEGRCEMDKGSIFDMNVGVDIFKFYEERIKLRPFFGYKKENWKWEEHNSYLIYLTDIDQFGTSGDLDYATGTGLAGNSSGTGITYEQEIDFPYFGVGMDYSGGVVGVEVYALYSPWVDIEATDYHLARELKFVDSYSDAEFWSVGASVRWDVRPKLALIGSVEYEEIPNAKGDTTVTSLEDPTLSASTEDGGGTGLSQTMFTISVVYSF